MPVQAKICCIKSVAEARLAFEAGAAAVGLVGPMPSGPGVIGLDVAADIAAAFPDRRTVLLTSKTTTQALIEEIGTVKPAAVQLVDAVPADTVAQLRARFPSLEIFQVIHVEGPQSLEDARAAATIADHILLDSGKPSQQILGGTGQVHDWSLSRAIVEAVEVPVWLAGGLSPDNVAQAIAQVRPFGVDVCSGLRPDAARDLDASRLHDFLKQIA